LVHLQIRFGELVTLLKPNFKLDLGNSRLVTGGYNFRIIHPKMQTFLSIHPVHPIPEETELEIMIGMAFKLLNSIELPPCVK